MSTLYYSDIANYAKLVSSKNLSGALYSANIKHYVYDCGWLKPVDHHVYVYQIDTENTNPLTVLNFTGRVYLSVIAPPYTKGSKDSVTIGFDIKCDHKGDRKWVLLESFDTEHILGLRDIDIEDEDFWYFVMGRIAHEVHRLLLHCKISTSALEEVKEYISKKKETFMPVLCNYLELKHWNEDKDLDNRDKLCRANAVTTRNRDWQFMTYTKQTLDLRRHDMYFRKHPVALSRYPAEEDI